MPSSTSSRTASRLQGRAKEDHGAYSAATFSLKGVLRAVEYILSEPKNGALFSSSSAGARLNALLLKVVARRALTPEERCRRLSRNAKVVVRTRMRRLDPGSAGDGGGD